MLSQKDVFESFKNYLLYIKVCSKNIVFSLGQFQNTFCALVINWRFFSYVIYLIFRKEYVYKYNLFSPQKISKSTNVLKMCLNGLYVTGKVFFKHIRNLLSIITII